jgi:hypothetical protein
VVGYVLRPSQGKGRTDRQTDRQTDTTDRNQRTLNNVTNLHQVFDNNLEFKVKKEDNYNYRAIEIGVSAVAVCHTTPNRDKAGQSVSFVTKRLNISKTRLFKLFNKLRYIIYLLNR